MKGFSGFGNSPMKAKTDAAKRLLKAVPNQKAYEKLSDIDKKGFDKAAKKAGLPTKKSPAKMGGPGVKASEKAARDARVNKLIKKGKKISSKPKHAQKAYFDKLENRVVSSARDRVSTKPASAGRKATTAASNVAKGFSSKAKSAISQIRGNKVGTFNGRDVKFIKRVPGKFARSASKTAMFRGIGKAVPAIGVAATIGDFYKSGQKHSGGKIKKGQKTNTMGFRKKSIFKK